MRVATIALLLAIVGCFVWWLASGSVTAPPQPQDEPSTTQPNTATPASATAPTPEVVAANEAALEREQAPTAPVDRAPKSDQSVFRGRCVDANGNPVAGVNVKVHGWGANSQRMAAHRRTHGEVQWEDPEQVITDDDGRFAISFVPPPPYQFVLDLKHPKFAPVGGRWSKIELGKVKDFGDVVLPAGAVVVGRVVDVDGVPQADVNVNLNRYNRPDRWRSEIHPTESARTRTAADGSFRMRDLLAPATWNLNLREVPLAEPRKEVAIELPTTTLELVVKRASEVQRIRGIVVDGDGKPVRGVQIEPVGRSGGGYMTSSKRDGTFDLKRHAQGDPDGDFALQAERRGYERLETEDKYEWGAVDVRLVVQAGIDLHVTVVRNDDGSAVEEFALRAFPKPGSVGRWSSMDTEIRGGWEHEGGRAIAQGLRRGPHVIVIEPRKKSGLARSEAVEVEIRDGPAPHIEVRLATLQRQSVRVVHADGLAAQGSKVELLEAPPGTTVTASTRAVPHEDHGWMRQGTVDHIDEAKTDATGACVVGGAGNHEYCLRITGGGHVPIIRPGITLGEQPVEIILPAAAALRVTIRPLELLGDLREQAMLPRTGVIAKDERTKAPGIRLRRKVGEDYEFAPAQRHQQVLFDEDGVAIVRGVPAGTWDLQLVSVVAYSNSGYSTRDDVVRTDLTLREGEESSIALDMPESRRARLHGSVLVGGKPFEGSLQLRGDVGVMHNGEPRIDYGNAMTDADGKFETLLLPGTWRIGPWIRFGERGLTAWTNQTVRTVAGKEARATFDVRLATTKLRVLAPDGTAAAGVRVQLRRDGGHLDAQGEVTDADGRTSVVATPGLAIPMVMRSKYSDPEKQREFYRKNAADPTAMERMLVKLPPILLTEHDKPEVEIRLPAEWNQ